MEHRAGNIFGVMLAGWTETVHDEQMASPHMRQLSRRFIMKPNDFPH
jgi:hypothetical protein